jgi:hypothetical protein
MSMQSFARLAVLLSAALWLPSMASADTTIVGEKLGAFFKITVPDDWNGDLVIHNHGFDFAPPAPIPAAGVAGFGPLGATWLNEGYAVAATSYSNCCWTLFGTKQDVVRLLGVFEANFGPPTNVILAGPSLGALVTAQVTEALSEGIDANVAGAFPECGALAGSRNWDAGIDVRLVYDVICGAVPAPASLGGTCGIPGGATGLPAPGFPPGLPSALIVGKVHTCLGVLAPPFARTPAQIARLAQFTSVTTIPESFVVTDMVFATNGLSNLIFAADKLNGGQGVTNIGVTYNDAAVDAAIERVTADQQARKDLGRNFTPKGEVGATKIVSLHTDDDGLAIVENEKEYQDVVPAANLTVAVVDEPGPTHCSFNGVERRAAWFELRDWIAGGPQPTAQDIQDRCLSIAPLPSLCRIDPAFVIADMDTRVPPR